jgi:hypothetical protein
MDIELFRQNPNFDQAVDTALRNGLTLARAIRTVARLFRDNGVRLPNYQIQNTRSRFESNLLEGPRKRDRQGRIKGAEQIQKKLNFEEPSVMSYAEDVNFKRSKTTLGRTRKRSANEIFSASLGSMHETVFRWQNCSKTLLGPGSNIIGFGLNPADTQGNLKQVVPIHMMSLTSHPGFPVNTTLGCHNRGMARFVHVPSGAAVNRFGYQWLSSSDPVGTFSNGVWSVEDGGTLLLNTDKTFHKWTDIRLNLYGSTLYPLKYRVRVFKGMPEEMQFMEFASWVGGITNNVTLPDVPITTETPLNEFLKDQIRPIVSNPILGSNSDQSYRGKFKVVSDKTYMIPCMSYGNAASEGFSGINATNVRTVNMFIRHDKFRDYAWRSKDTDKEVNPDLGGIGYTKTNTSLSAADSLLCDVDREERMFLCITCNAPSLVSNALYTVRNEPPVVVSDTSNTFQTEGTYDIVVRNCFRDGQAS